MRIYLLLHKPSYLAEEDEPFVVDGIDEHSLDAGCEWDGDLDEAGRIAKHGDGQFRIVKTTVPGTVLNNVFKPLHVAIEEFAPVEEVP